MNYNILHGFHSGGTVEKEVRPYEFQPNRLNCAKAIIAAENPDILLLNEACFVKPYREKFTGNTLYIDYQKEFNFPFFYPINTHSEWGTCILSRFPFEYVKDYSEYHRVFIKSSFRYDNQVIFLDIAHPHPDLNENDRKNFFRNCLRDITRPCILAGDFNSLSDEDHYNKEKLINGFRRFMGESANKKIEDLLLCLAVKEIRSHGLIDTFTASGSKWDYTIPTDYLPEFSLFFIHNT